MAHIPEQNNYHSDRCEDFKSKKIIPDYECDIFQCRTYNSSAIDPLLQLGHERGEMGPGPVTNVGPSTALRKPHKYIINAFKKENLYKKISMEAQE
jgi:hypothetical protein